ncbi:riboflavin biosynthesis protein RibF, partial [bacterium]|nr:riboflavin biosynthesis protein RibF [bacterium]
MEVIRGLDNLKCTPNAAVTVGSFDGLHLGHQRILKRMCESPKRPVTVVTFEPHPQVVVQPFKDLPLLLTSFEERIELFEKFSVDRLIIINFDEKFAKISATDFIRRILVKRVGVAQIFVGPKHGFGAGRKGDVVILRRIGKESGFEVSVVPPVVREGDYVSSSRIRRCLSNGDALSAWRFAGHPFFIIGKVIEGERRGVELGLPTANLKPDNERKLIPKVGVYATITEFDGMRLPSVSHIGGRPTFPGSEPSIETHIIGFNEDIYG